PRVTAAPGVGPERRFRGPGGAQVTVTGEPSGESVTAAGVMSKRMRPLSPGSGRLRPPDTLIILGYPAGSGRPSAACVAPTGRLRSPAGHADRVPGATHPSCARK